MRIDGEWLLCDDGIARPAIRVDVSTRNGTWLAIEVLLDTGADRTVFTRGVFDALGLPPITPLEHIGGVGGLMEHVDVETHMRLPRDDGGTISVGGRFAAFLEEVSLDMSVLGRDVSNRFSVIVDRPGNVVCLVGQRHRYVIESD